MGWAGKQAGGRELTGLSENYVTETTSLPRGPLSHTLVPAPWIMGDLREKGMISSPAPRNAPDTDEDFVPNRLAYGNAQ